MTASTVLLSLLITAVLGVIGVAYALNARRRAMSRLPGTFDCSLHVGDGSRRPRWRMGMANLAGTSLNWYPLFGFSRKPLAKFPRDDMEIAKRDRPSDEDAHSLVADAQVVTLRLGTYSGSPRDELVAMDTESLSALSSWLESAPPGYNLMIGRFT